MDESINNKTNSTADDKKLLKISLILIAAGAVATVGLIFFFYTLFDLKTEESTPEIYDARQLAATDSSVLLTWSSTSSAQRYIVRYNEHGDTQSLQTVCDQPFAALRHLQPNTTYDVEITAVIDQQEYGRSAITCVTESFCKAADIQIENVGSSDVTLSWNFQGADKGFQVVAYAVDENGQRHITSKIANVRAGNNTRCRISGLSPEVNYTVAVIPMTRYCEVAKSTFQTQKYSKKYDKLNVIRSVICLFTSDDSPQAVQLINLKPNTSYKTSTIINGSATRTDKVNMMMYITDSQGNIISDFAKEGVYTNPNGEHAYVYRVILLDFKSPKSPGNYNLYLAIDGQTVRKIEFAVNP